MTPDELRSALRVLGYPSTRLAHILGVAPGSVRNWLAGRADIPETVARVVRCIIAGELDPASLLARASMENER